MTPDPSSEKREPRPDIFRNYDLEEVMFRKDGATGLIYMKFYGGREHPDPVPSSHRLYHDASCYGECISREQYVAGKPARMDNS